jgi:hypothetical protein
MHDVGMGEHEARMGRKEMYSVNLKERDHSGGKEVNNIKINITELGCEDAD